MQMESAPMIFQVFIEPHERFKAMEAYRQWLTVRQQAEIEDAPDSAIICLCRANGVTEVQIIEEG